MLKKFSDYRMNTDCGATYPPQAFNKNFPNGAKPAADTQVLCFAASVFSWLTIC